MDGADLPPGLLRPPERVRHWDPSYRIRVFQEVGDWDDLLVYNFPNVGFCAEIVTLSVSPRYRVAFFLLPILSILACDYPVLSILVVTK